MFFISLDNNTGSTNKLAKNPMQPKRSKKCFKILEHKKHLKEGLVNNIRKRREFYWTNEKLPQKYLHRSKGLQQKILSKNCNDKVQSIECKARIC